MVKLCEWLEVSRSGYYDWLTRPVTPAAERRALLGLKVKAIFERSRGTYGARRIARALRHAGEIVSLRLIRRLMADLGLVPAAPRPYKRTTIADEALAAIADHLGRDFSSDAPGVKLVGDITCVRTWEGWLYLATVIDCFSRRIIGWAMADHMRASLICDALEMAATNTTFAPGVIFHSDRGTQYTSSEFAACCRRLNVIQSMGRTGICWDNALAESFFASLKNELVYRIALPTRGKARLVIAEYIEVFYNRQRLHSANDYKTPAEVEAAYHNKRIAA